MVPIFTCTIAIFTFKIIELLSYHKFTDTF